MKIQVQTIEAIRMPTAGYVGWPTLCKTRSGELLAVYSGGRMAHICPFGQVHLIRSPDQGRTWSRPRVLVDGPLDDRDAGLLETTSGTLLMNWFTALTWLEVMEQRPDHIDFATRTPEQMAQWEIQRSQITEDLAQRELGAWCLRSTDGGATWSSRIDTVVNSPHGPIQLSDGRLLYPGNHRNDSAPWRSRSSPLIGRIGVAESHDDGRSWQWLADMAPMPGHQRDDYHELHGVQATDGRIVVQLRNHTPASYGHVLQTESHDGGRTWSAMHDTGLWGYPPFLLRMRDGRLLTTLGHRRPGRGIQVAFSDDHGETWSPQQPLNTDSVSDMGYPSTVELEDGAFLTLWYDRLDGGNTFLRLARWKAA